jgi:hypothetical protein
MDAREAVNRAAAEHVERLRKRLQEGKHEIARQRAVLERYRVEDEPLRRDSGYDEAA